ncbi:lichenan operon transcriptional antiterminator [Enterococcus sp. PF1-24]|uniref:BglG family transcription antiterminator n=1 Tax=unclassified Enterococcus TaxID=2608891 RepID=UPI00247656ED|nr:MULTISPECIES: BglG family transcription antiterminator [unclassified Enterococcus]MDH6365400.1 lichenan operon transcriptional antiterminator [Enterococcus sp. PFB1-1]MDH6402528.1 lichenan operon transcriptional antiterminator [Enterococcus sp. PF1-24]
MLNQRQQAILKEFEKHSPSFLPAEYLVKKFGVSTRTIQTDVKQIKIFLAKNGFAELVSVTSKGSKLLIHNMERYELEFSHDKQENNQVQSDRVRKLCILLLNQRSPVNKQYLEENLFISSSTLNSDLKEVGEIFNGFHLDLIRKRSIGVSIVGAEYDKRKCLLKLGHMEIHQNQEKVAVQDQNRQDIEKILVSVLLKYHYHISDTLFQNLIVHIEMAIKRMNTGFYIKNHELDKKINLESEIQVANEIFSRLSNRMFFKVSDEEVVNLAIYIKGKSDYENDDYISEEVNTFILYSLEEINEKFNIDFSQEIDLRISLALHLMPLITRIEYNIQNDNQLLAQIKQSFPLAFDIAAYMCLLLQRNMDKKITEGEIAYLAIYFNQYLSKYNDISGKQRVLIITSLKRSESVLLRQRFATWFSNEISILTLLNIHEIQEVDIEDYDVIFTTEQTDLSEKMGAILISFYPSEAEYSKIKLAIDGFKDKFEIIDLFCEGLFHFGDFTTKSELLDKICFNSSDKVGGKTSQLRQAVDLREELGSSYFGNRIALPHPINPFSVETFVSVVLLKNEIDWDAERNQVSLVMLVVIEKNNAKVFQLWNYLSKIIQEKTFVDRLLENPTFENFKLNLSQLLDEYI